ncbi:glycosyltransferase [Nocardioides agariphilus]|uniref:Glycosyltransferase n=1 Tax=Nocardioides agariphilus TaxID=433664 RepID=A0A930VQH8_9ACTN|nr:glycosyltransferase [Nocardioides agariphilus]
MSDLVVVSLEAWDGVWRRNQHLVSRLLALDPGLRVLFVEPPVDVLHGLRRGTGLRRGRGLRAEHLPGAEGRLHLFEPTKWLPRRVDGRADGRLADAVLRSARRLGMTSPVLWLNDPLAADLLRRSGWPALYDITDDWLQAQRPDAVKARLVAAESYLLDHCEHVVVCSPRLLETKHGKRTTLVPNAVDVDAYRGDLPRPADLPTGRTVVYVGTLHRDRLDVRLSEELARSLTGTAVLTFVGPVALDERDRQLLIDAGAHLLGPREHAQVPAYLKHADVLVVPHVVNAFTDSLDPIKVYEYLAAGRPIVSTPVAGFRELDRALVSVVPATELADRVREVLSRPPAMPGSDEPAVPSWDDRASAMRRVIDELPTPPRPDQ